MRMRFSVLATAALATGAAIALAFSAGGGADSSLEAASRSPETKEAHERSIVGPVRVVVSELAEPTANAQPIAQPPHRQGPAGARAEATAAQVPRANSTDRGVSGGPGAPAITSSFDGLDSDANTPNGITPPDPQIAVGPDHVVEFVNVVGRIYTRTGTPVETFTLSSFFGVPGGHSHFDPKILYDAISGRWFAVYASFFDDDPFDDEGRLFLAVSTTDDPTGTWNVYNVLYTNVFPDYPGLGVTDDKVTVSSNVFDIDGPPGAIAPGCSMFSGFCGVETIVFQKSDLLAGVDNTDLGSHTFPPDEDRFTVRPAQSLSSVSDQYMTTWDLAGLDILTVFRITGTPDGGNVTEAAATGVTTVTHLDPPPSRTAGTDFCRVFDDVLEPPPCIDSGDYRMLDAVWRDNVLWSSSSASCQPDGDSVIRSCAHVVEVSTIGTPSLVQDIMFGASGHFYSWPAVRTDASNNLYVSMTHTDTSIFAEAVVSGRKVGDPAGDLSGTAVLRAGEVEHISSRWGDYLGLAVDPEDTACVWAVGEYAKDTSNADWGTYIGALTYSGGCGGAPATATPTAAGPTPTPPPGATATPTSPPGPTNTPGPPPSSTVFGDANCDGVANVLDALLILQFDALIILTMPCKELAHGNVDGVINVVDAALIIQFDAGLIDSLPVGGPTRH